MDGRTVFLGRHRRPDHVELQGCGNCLPLGLHHRAKCSYQRCSSRSSSLTLLSQVANLVASCGNGTNPFTKNFFVKDARKFEISFQEVSLHLPPSSAAELLFSSLLFHSCIHLRSWLVFFRSLGLHLYAKKMGGGDSMTGASPFLAPCPLWRLRTGLEGSLSSCSAVCQVKRSIKFLDDIVMQCGPRTLCRNAKLRLLKQIERRAREGYYSTSASSCSQLVH